MTFEEFKNIIDYSGYLVNWDSFTEYTEKTTVKHADSLYQALQANTNVEPGSVAAAGVWKLINESFEAL